MPEVEPAPDVEIAAEAEAIEEELPQTPTVRAEVPEEEAEADDFSWLTGDTVPAPSPEGEPPAAPVLAETVKLKREEPEVRVEEPELRLPEPSAPGAEAESAAVTSQPPEGDPQDFSWLDNAKDEPLDFSAFEAEKSSPVDAASASDSKDEELDADRTVLREPGPTLKLPMSDVILPPVAISEPAPADAPPVEPQAEAVPEGFSFTADDVAPAPVEPSAEGMPDFSAMAQAASQEQEEEAPPPFVVDRSAAQIATAAPSSPRPAGKAAKPKGWWPFGGKKKEPASPKAKTPTSETAMPVSEPVAAPAGEPAPLADEPPPPVVAPQFAMPPIEEPAATEQAVVAESSKEDDDALGQFFKSLK
jgi:hypothetical protein